MGLDSLGQLSGCALGAVMDYLPGVPATSGAALYPLSALSARAMVRALSVEGAERARVLTSALVDDACFALWCMAVRQGRSLPHVETAEAMGAWLAEELPALGAGIHSSPTASDGRQAIAANEAALAWASAACVRELVEDAEAGARAVWQALVLAPPQGGDDVAARTRFVLHRYELPADEALFATRAAKWQARIPDYMVRWQALAPTWASCLPGLCAAQVRLGLLERSFESALRDAKLTALKAFAYGAGHEINNPLANIASRAQSLLVDETHPERRRKLASINAQAFRAHEMLADLMLFARPQSPAGQTVELAALLNDVLTQFGPLAEEQGTALRFEPGEVEITVCADPTQLRVAVGALMQNALEAVAQGGEVELSLAPAQDSGKAQAVIEIHDTGPGIPDADVRLIFDPYYSGREAGRGLGFGLPKAWRIATDHGGGIDVCSRAGEGTTFRLWLPCVGATAS